MARIAYVLLCHKDPEGIIAQARRLIAAGDVVAIHFDRRAPKADFDRLRRALGANSSVIFTARRVRCGWGTWSLVAATLLGLRAALERFPDATHFYLLSGACMPIKSAEHAHAVLDRDDVDYIESFDFHQSDWIRTGLREERLLYRHIFNERTQTRLFYASLRFQQWLGLRHHPPADLQVQIGSQWWCLRRRTVEAVLAFCRRRPDVLRYFRRTWIPDETFFQTLVRHLVPEPEIRTRTLTFLMFSDYGMPVTFYNDHHDLLLGQDHLFARKISADATELKHRLGRLYAARGVDFPLSDEGRHLFRFLTAQGRIGRRFAPRFWEDDPDQGRGRTLLIVACKKWHVGKRLAERVRQVTAVPAVGYLFNEPATPLPDLGGIETTLEKRTRHRRTVVRMLFDHWQTDRLILCIDPADVDQMRDIRGARLLEVDCAFTDGDLVAHARRVGLAGAATPRQTLERLLPTLRRDVRLESDRLDDAGFVTLYRLRQSATAEENAVPLAAFLGISEAQAREIAATDNLFVD